MNVKMRNIEVDVVTAETLEARAAQRGLSVAELVAEMTTLQEAPISADDVLELDRRWAGIQAGEPTVRHDDVVKWLRTWGTPEFRSWNKR